MIRIFDNKTPFFASLGLGTLLPKSCTVKEELNGMFELDLEHPYDEWGKWKRIEVSNIILASTPRGNQAFRIYRVNPSMKCIQVSARHIFYDLLDNYIQTLNILSVTPQTALNSIRNAFNYAMPFTLSTTITGSGNINATGINPVAVLLGSGDDNDSFVSVFGGEILRDNYQIAFMPTIGNDRGVQIRYGKNLVGLEVDEDISEVATRIYPVGKDGLKGNAIDSPYINSYPYPKARQFEDTSLTTIAQLENFAKELLSSGVDLPTVNIKASLQLLSKTEEYKNYSSLENVQLGDIVTVSNINMNFSKKSKVISYEWDCLMEKYINVELGDFLQDITGSITSGKRSYDVASTASTEARQIMSLINGKVAITNTYFYYCINGSDYTTATELFRISPNGFEYSNNGYNGNWQTLIAKP